MFYVVLAGPDFGAATWQLTARQDEEGDRLRDLGHEAMAPVWEANHVWLIFVLTVLWTTYPVAFGSIASTLCVPLFLAGLGIVVRGAAYALRAGTTGAGEARRIDTASALSSVLTPFALGAALGGIVSGRVPVGNAAGIAGHELVEPDVGRDRAAGRGHLGLPRGRVPVRPTRSGWRRTTSRRRCAGARWARGSSAGALAVVGLVVLREDAFRVRRAGAAAPGCRPVVSAVAGVRDARAGMRCGGTSRRAERRGGGGGDRGRLGAGTAARAAARPDDPRGRGAAGDARRGDHRRGRRRRDRLPVAGAALPPDARRDAARGGAARAAEAGRAGPRALLGASRHGLLVRAAGACLIAGFGLLTVLDAGWAHALGVVALLGFIVLGFLACLPAELWER